jgi:DNA uptake protein ComE-like DNA-binding protein
MFALRLQPQTSQTDTQKLDSLVMLLEAEKSQISYFKFNPNTLPPDSLTLLGIPVKVAERLDNYRLKGGVFQVKDDVKKIYGLSDELYLTLATYIDLPDSIVVKPVKNQAIDINKVNVELLKMQPGIGDFLAGRIMKYRDLLGGFVSLDQLDEVYGLEDSVLKNLKSRSYISPDFVPRKIKLNSVSAEILQRHPYIPPPLAEDIVRFRELNGAIESEKLLVSFKSVDKGNFEKLILYLDFQ